MIALYIILYLFIGIVTLFIMNKKDEDKYPGLIIIAWPFAAILFTLNFICIIIPNYIQDKIDRYNHPDRYKHDDYDNYDY